MKLQTQTVVGLLCLCCSAILYPRLVFALPEICANGIDDDGVGGDALCPGSDKDFDGFLDTSSGGVDCDDTDFRIYPGVVTTSGCPTGQTRTCQGNGSFTACSASVVCEAASGSSCKYIDCGSGSDSNNGSFGSPWKSLRAIGDHHDSAVKPAGWYQVKPGDVIYIKGASACSDYYAADGTNERVSLRLTTSGTAGKPITIKRYPGSTAKLNPPFTSSSQGHVLRITGLSYLKLDDLEITGTYSAPIYITGSSNVEISRSRCYNVQGTTNDNIACINAASDPTSHYVHHNEFSDVYDPDQPASNNVSLIVYFGGGDNRFEYNRLGYSHAQNYGGPVVGQCLKYKHPTTTGSVTVRGNLFWNCHGAAYQSSSENLQMDHNLLVNEPNVDVPVLYHCGDLGSGSAFCRNGIVEYNTVVNARALSFRSSISPQLGTTRFRKNNVVDRSSTYNTENGFYRVERYGSDSEYQQFVNANAILSDENCFYNPVTSLMFDFFGDGTASTGSQYSFSGWQGTGRDTHSANTDPGYDSYFRASTGACSNYGWMAGSSTNRPSPPTGLSVTLVP